MRQGKGGAIRSQDPRYREWIEAYVDREIHNPNLAGHWEVRDVLRGSCLSACHEMLEPFPELFLIRGHVVAPQYASDPGYLDPGNGHYWLETEDGKIVDPTARQYPEDVVYLAFDESKADALPVGKCHNCGFYVYARRDGICSDDCVRDSRERNAQWMELPSPS